MAPSELRGERPNALRTPAKAYAKGILQGEMEE